MSMQTRRVALVKVFEPAKPYDVIPHPDRYRFTHCWVDQESAHQLVLVPLGSATEFGFLNGECYDFMGKHAVVVRVGDRHEFDEDALGTDTFQEVQKQCSQA